MCMSLTLRRCLFPDLTSYDGGLCGCDDDGRLCVLDAALNVRCRVDVRAALLSDRRCRASLESRWGAHTVETMELIHAVCAVPAAVALCCIVM